MLNTVLGAGARLALQPRSEMSYCDDLKGLRVIPWRAGNNAISVRLVRHMWHYNPRMASLWHPCLMASKNLEMCRTFAL
jgi:hypothetical protein